MHRTPLFHLDFMTHASDEALTITWGWQLNPFWFILCCTLNAEAAEKFAVFVFFNTTDFLVMERYEMVEVINTFLTVGFLAVTLWPFQGKR